MKKLPTWALLAMIAACMTACVAITMAGGTKRNAPIDGAVCAAIEADAKAFLDFWTLRGVIMNIRRRQHRAVVEVRTARWAEINSAEKKAIALSAYCSVRDDSGNGFVQIEGGLQEDLGTVIDGQWRN